MECPWCIRSRTWQIGKLGKVPNFTIDVTSLVPGPVPQRDFTLQAFGIRVEPPPKRIPVAYYLLRDLVGLWTARLAFPTSPEARPHGPSS